MSDIIDHNNNNNGIRSQGKVVIVASVIFHITVIVTSLMRNNFNITLALMLLLSIALTALAVYDIQCLESGGCTVWSWIRTVLIVLTMVLSTLTIIMLGSKDNEMSNSVYHETKKKREKFNRLLSERSKPNNV